MLHVCLEVKQILSKEQTYLKLFEAISHIWLWTLLPFFGL